MSEITYQEYLEKYGQLTYRNVGVSMLPILKQGRDLFTIKKKTHERCKKYDVILFLRPRNKYVLHRVIKVRKSDYVVLGDNCEYKEYGITDDDILAVMSSFTHKGKEISVSDWKYRLYERIWYCLYPIRKLYFKIRRLAVKFKNMVKQKG